MANTIIMELRHNNLRKNAPSENYLFTGCVFIMEFYRSKESLFYVRLKEIKIHQNTIITIMKTVTIFKLFMYNIK